MKSRARGLLLFILVSLIFAGGIKKYGTAGFVPETGNKSIAVKFEYKGAFAEDIERAVFELESAFMRIRGIKEIFSVSESEKGSLYITFSDKSDFDKAYVDVSDCVAVVWADFPDTVNRPSIIRSGYGGYPVFTAFFEKDSGCDPEEIKKIFGSADGAGETESSSGNRKDLIIKFDLEKLSAFDLFPDDLNRAVASNNIAGNIILPGGTPLIFVPSCSSPEDFGKISLREDIFLDDVASVLYEKKEEIPSAKIGGREIFFFAVMKAAGGNTVKLCRELTRLTEQAGGNVLYNEGMRIEKTLKETALSSFAGMICVLAAGWFLTGRFSHIAMIFLDMLFSLLCSAFAVSLSGFEFDVLVLAGLSVCSSLSVNNAILFYDTFYELGDPSGAVSRISSPLIYSSVAVSALFVPLFFSSEAMRTLFSGLAVSVSAGLAGSLVFVFLFIPSFLGEDKAGKRKPLFRAGWLEKGIGWISKSMSGHIAFARLFCALLFIGVFFASASAKYELFSFSDDPDVSFFMEYESGVSFPFVKRVAKETEKTILGKVEGEKLISRLERSRAEFRVKDEDPEIVKKMTADAEERYPDVFFYFPERGKKKRTDVSVYGENIDDIKKDVLRLSAELKSKDPDTDIIFNFKSDVENIIMKISPLSVGAGLYPLDICSLLYNTLSEPVISKFFPSSSETDIKSRGDDKWKKSVGSLLSVPCSCGDKVFGADFFIETEKRALPEKIYHRNRQRELSFSVSGTEFEKLNETVENFSYTEGCRGEAGRKVLEAKENSKQIPRDIAFASALIFFIFYFKYGSLKFALITILQIPFALFLPFLFFNIFGTAFSMISFPALVLTVGISVTDSIVVLKNSDPREMSVKNITEALKRGIGTISASSAAVALGVLPLTLLTLFGKNALFASFSSALLLGIAGHVVFFPLVLFSFAEKKR